MTSFHVDPHALDDAATHISRTMDSLQSDITSLTSQLRALDGSWAGPAAIAFAGLVDEWTTTSNRVTDNLGAIGSALRAIQSHYLDTEESNVRLLGR